MNTMSEQMSFSAEVMELMQDRKYGTAPMACVKTYGCQQNVADGEKLKGMLAEMGFIFTEDTSQADLIIFNTCAVREHAQDRVFGNIGELKSLKAEKPELLIAVCGCMTEQEIVAEKLKKSYPFVNIVFGTHMLHRLPEILYSAITKGKRVFLRGGESNEIYEGIPTRREGGSKAWVTVMYGCNNFCSYCIVPYVRGREKSRKSQDIYDEVKLLVDSGYKEITLLGQNVNSYGRGLDEDINFSGLLRKLDSIEGDYRIRFMTSHPKDASKELFDTMAASRHIPHFIHLPVQSGNNRVLREMNRGYSREDYLKLIAYARSVMPDIKFTSDILMGFPGESYQEFCDTLDLVKEVKFSSVFSFIYSKRSGTAAEKLPDPVPYEEKTKWFAELMELQAQNGHEITASMVGKKERVLVEGRNPKNGLLSGRTAGFMIAEFPGGDELIDQFVDLEIISAQKWNMQGKAI